MSEIFRIPENMQTPFQHNGASYVGIFFSGSGYSDASERTLVQIHMLTVSISDGERLPVGEHIAIDSARYKITGVLRCDGFFELRLGVLP